MSKSDFSFYLVWVIIFTVINIGIIFLLEYFELIPLLKKTLSSNTTQVQDILPPNNETTMHNDNDMLSEYTPFQKQTRNHIPEPPKQPPLDSSYNLSYSYSIPSYFENIVLEEEPTFLTNDGSIFQLGYISISAIFPYQFTTILQQQLPAAFQNQQNTSLVLFRVLLGWKNIPTFTELYQQQTQRSSSITLIVPPLTVLELQMSDIATLDTKTQDTVSSLIRQEIEQQLQRNSIPKELKSNALRILGAQYTLNNFQDITMSFFTQ